MFGYININQKELSEESKKIYQAYYCGLCQKLKTNCGTKGQMLLSYDLCINSSILGIEGTVKLIIQYVEDFEKKNNADILEK